jgi:hypothetical protein
MGEADIEGMTYCWAYIEIDACTGEESCYAYVTVDGVDMEGDCDELQEDHYYDDEWYSDEEESNEDESYGDEECDFEMEGPLDCLEMMAEYSVEGLTSCEYWLEIDSCTGEEHACHASVVVFEDEIEGDCEEVMEEFGIVMSESDDDEDWYSDEEEQTYADEESYGDDEDWYSDEDCEETEEGPMDCSEHADWIEGFEGCESWVTYDCYGDETSCYATLIVDGEEFSGECEELDDMFQMYSDDEQTYDDEFTYGDDEQTYGDDWETYGDEDCVAGETETETGDCFQDVNDYVDMLEWCEYQVVYDVCSGEEYSCNVDVQVDG